MTRTDELRSMAREIMRRPYTKVIRGDAIEGYLAEVAEFPGCLTAGATEEEALANLHEAMTVWLMTALDDHAEIPEPMVTVG